MHQVQQVQYDVQLFREGWFKYCIIGQKVQILGGKVQIIGQEGQKRRT
jgi:hypothetical protein